MQLPPKNTNLLPLNPQTGSVVVVKSPDSEVGLSGSKSYYCHLLAVTIGQLLKLCNKNPILLGTIILSTLWKFYVDYMELHLLNT